MFQAKMGTIKDRHGIDLTEAKEIKERWQEYTEELYKKGLNDLDNRDGEITHLEPDFLECEIKWALGSITMNKASGDDGIPLPRQDSKEMWVQSLGREGPLEEGIAIHFCILSWRIPWTKEPGGLQSIGSQRAKHN